MNLKYRALSYRGEKVVLINCRWGEYLDASRAFVSHSPSDGGIIFNLVE